jgi:GT2 family glycosyltransferase
MNITFIIPSSNNLKHLKNVYTSIEKNAPTCKLVLLDDGSTDGTFEWMCSLSNKNITSIYRSDKRIGHTILYDKGIELAQTDIVGILHADMILGPNYIENMLKHLKPNSVICGTRIEPPLHPEGKEKIVKDFGTDFDSLDINAFESFVLESQIECKDKTSYGMFAPWILYKEDYIKVEGHDKLFAPFPYEDSDIFQRWILAGFELIQSRDAFIYHLTCRGHRWSEQIGKDDEYYKHASHKASRNYLRKWGSWIKNDEYQHPLIVPKYNIALVVSNCNLDILAALEPFCDRIYIDDDMQVITIAYIESEQPNTRYDLTKRVLITSHNDAHGENDIIVELDAKQLDQNSFGLIQQLPEIITQTDEHGVYELGPLKITINSLMPIEIPIRPIFSTLI